MGQLMTSKAPHKPLARYVDPWQTLRSEMEQLFDNFFEGGLTPKIYSSDDKMLMPSLDVKEDDMHILIEAELPGLDENDVQVSLRDGVLSISGVKKTETIKGEADFHIMERRYGSFQRSLQLPEAVDEDAVEATFDKGVLTIVLPKKPDAVKHEKKIAIKAK